MVSVAKVWFSHFQLIFCNVNSNQIRSEFAKRFFCVCRQDCPRHLSFDRGPTRGQCGCCSNESFKDKARPVITTGTCTTGQSGFPSCRQLNRPASDFARFGQPTTGRGHASTCAAELDDSPVGLTIESLKHKYNNGLLRLTGKIEP